MMKIGDRRQSIRSITIYKKLDAARQAQSSSFDRVWACDSRNRDGVIVKVYVVMQSKEFYEYITSTRNSKMCWYEVIGLHSPCSFYLDIELETSSFIDDNYLASRIKLVKKDVDELHVDKIIKDYKEIMNISWTDDRCSHVLRYLKKVVSSFEAAEGITTGGIWSSSCRPGKLSFHYVNQHFILERNYLSMRVVSWLFSRVLWDQINLHLSDMLVDLCRKEKELPSYVYEAVLPLLMLEHQQDKKGWLMNNDTIVDERVYNRNQLFRLIGNHKLGKSNFMTAELSRCVTNSSSNLTNISDDSKRYLSFIEFSSFEASLVTLLSMPKGRTYLIPGCYPFIVKVQKDYLEEFPIEENRYSVLKFNCLNNFSREREGSCVRFPVTDNKRKLFQFECASASISPNLHTTECYDEDKIVTRADHIDVKISECAIGENLIHECTRYSAKKHSMFGTAAAFIIKGYGDNNFLCCHACQQSYAILKVHDPAIYRCK